MSNGKTIYEKLSNIQLKLNVPKNLYNKFGNFYYRNVETIVEVCKPICKEEGALLLFDDKVECIGGRNYIKSTAILIDLETGDKVTADGYAWEELSKGMASAQQSGSCSSYARKYAVSALFLLDDNKDPDTDEAVEMSRKGAEAEAKAKAKAIEEADTVISKDDAEYVENLAKEKGVAMEVALKDYKVKKASDLKKSQYNHLVSRLMRTGK